MNERNLESNECYPFAFDELSTNMIHSNEGKNDFILFLNFVFPKCNFSAHG